MTKQSTSTAILRGLAGRCPVCGEGKLFRGFLKAQPCPVCGSDNTDFPSDDMPPYLTIFLVGHLTVPLFLWSDRVIAPPLWVQFAFWIPLMAALCLLLLPRMKGAVIGACQAFDLHRTQPAR